MKELIVSLLLWVVAMAGFWFFANWMFSSMDKECPPSIPPEMYSTLNSCHYGTHNNYHFYNGGF